MIWDRLFAEGEVDRAFDYHRWRVIRNLIEVQGGLEMEDRHFYTGFVNEAGTLIKGLAAKWKMADWLIEKLEEIVGSRSPVELRLLYFAPCAHGDLYVAVRRSHGSCCMEACAKSVDDHQW